jgi:endoglucanase
MYLPGLNIGGYLSQAKFTDKHLKTFITEKDFAVIKKWGFSLIRLPVDYFLFENDAMPYVYDGKRLKLVDNCVKWAEKYGLWIMIDLHKAPGHSFALKERETNDIWKRNSESRKRFIKIWEFLAARYRGEGRVMYEVMNEPVAKKDPQWNALAQDAIDAIRRHDKKHWIVVESNKWGNVRTFSKLKKFSDKKIIYSFHFYDPILVTNQLAEWTGFYKYNIYRKLVDYPGRPANLNGIGDRVRQKDRDFTVFFRDQDKYWDKKQLEKMVGPVLKFKMKYRVPVLCGEFGCVAHGKPETRKNWTEDFITILKKNRISYTYWTYKNMDFGLWDHTEKYRDNANYRNKERQDKPILKALQSGIL